MAGATRIVVSSFNQPRSLRLVLRGVLALAGRPDALYVADDGSDADVAELVRGFSASAPFPVHFLTQENLGFRKARALNAALRRISGGRVLFLDGDTVPHRSWLREHERALDAGADYATGGYVYLDLEQARALEDADAAPSVLDPADLRRLRRVHRKQAWHRLLRTPDKPKILGGNWSACWQALERVNGFDENYEGFGKEDSDIRNRLNAAGCRGRSVWSRAFVFHCAHELDPQRLSPQDARRPPDRAYYARNKTRARCARGLVEEPGEGA